MEGIEEIVITNPNYALRITEESRNAIFAAVQAIDSVCDGAKTIEVSGFQNPILNILSLA